MVRGTFGAYPGASRSRSRRGRPAHSQAPGRLRSPHVSVETIEIPISRARNMEEAEIIVGMLRKLKRQNRDPYTMDMSDRHVPMGSVLYMPDYGITMKVAAQGKKIDADTAFVGDVMTFSDLGVAMCSEDDDGGCVTRLSQEDVDKINSQPPGRQSWVYDNIKTGGPVYEIIR